MGAMVSEPEQTSAKMVMALELQRAAYINSSNR